MLNFWILKCLGVLGNASTSQSHSPQKWCSFINRGFWMPARRALCLVTNSLGSGSSCKMERITWWTPMKSLSSAQEKVLSNKVCWVLVLADASDHFPCAVLVFPSRALGGAPGTVAHPGPVFMESKWGQRTQFSFNINYGHSGFCDLFTCQETRKFINNFFHLGHWRLLGNLRMAKYFERI